MSSFLISCIQKDYTCQPVDVTLKCVLNHELCYEKAPEQTCYFQHFTIKRQDIIRFPHYTRVTKKLPNRHTKIFIPHTTTVNGIVLSRFLPGHWGTLKPPKPLISLIYSRRIIQKGLCKCSVSGYLEHGY